MEYYAKKLLDNLPHLKKQKMDLVLEGGAFNGSYLIGALHLIKEMEQKKMIMVCRISGCSIGSLIGFLYLIDRLDLVQQFSDFALKDLRENLNLNKTIHLLRSLFDTLDKTIYEKVNRRLFIKYFNVWSMTPTIRCTFKSNEDLMECIIRSSFIPYCINGQFCYNKKYMDGLLPYVFRSQKKRKIMYLSLCGLDKIQNGLKITNETNNYTRMLSGLLDVQNFFITKHTTSMCSFVDQWTVKDKFVSYCQVMIEKIIVLLVYWINKMDCRWSKSIIYQLLCKIAREMYVYVFQTYLL